MHLVNDVKREKILGIVAPRWNFSKLSQRALVQRRSATIFEGLLIKVKPINMRVYVAYTFSCVGVT